jgi:hypothetical protein
MDNTENKTETVFPVNQSFEYIHKDTCMNVLKINIWQRLKNIMHVISSVNMYTSEINYMEMTSSE